MDDKTRSFPDVVGFGAFEVDLRSGELRKAGTRIALQEQPLRVLARLLREPGELVSRDQLRRELWPDDTFLDFEHGLNAAVKRLRDALGDSADTPRFIETLPRRGYRFIAPVDVRRVPPGDAPPAGAGWSSSHLVRVALALLLGLAALAAGAAWWWSSEPAGLPAELAAPARGAEVYQVTVAAFENRSTERALTVLGEQIAGRLVSAIARVPGVDASLEVTPPAGTGAPAGTAPPGSPGRPASLRVAGTIFVQGDRLDLQGRILDAASGRLLHALAPLSAASGDPGDAIARLEGRVAGAVAVHYDDFFGGLDVLSHPPTLDAYREYRIGLEIFSWDYPRALTHLQRAVEIDPQFWLPRVIMLFAYFNTWQPDEAYAQLSEMDRQRDRLGPSERLFIDFLRENSAGRSVEALRVLRDLEARMPRSLVVNHNIVQLSIMQNRPREAIAAYDRLAFDVRSLRHSIGTFRLRLLTHALHMLEEHERELEESRRGQQYAPGMLVFVAAEVDALAALGRLEELNAAVERSLAIPATRGTAGEVLEQAAMGLRAHGHRQPSLALARRAVEWRRNRPAPDAATPANRAALGRALYLAEQWKEAEQVFTQLAAEQPSAEHLGPMGTCAARLGDARRAGAIAAKLRALSDRELLGAATFWRARVAAVLGDQPGAFELLREALAHGEPFGVHLRHLPDFESLQGYPPFEELLRPKG